MTKILTGYFAAAAVVIVMLGRSTPLPPHRSPDGAPPCWPAKKAAPPPCWPAKKAAPARGCSFTHHVDTGSTVDPCSTLPPPG